MLLKHFLNALNSNLLWKKLYSMHSKLNYLTFLNNNNILNNYLTFLSQNHSFLFRFLSEVIKMPPAVPVIDVGKDKEFGKLVFIFFFFCCIIFMCSLCNIDIFYRMCVRHQQIWLLLSTCSVFMSVSVFHSV